MEARPEREVWIGLGSNLDQPVAQLDAALDALVLLPNSHALRVSSYYLTPPWGDLDQPHFINAVAVFTSGQSAAQLLANLQAIERAAGRTRSGRRWGPRRLDLDLLLITGETHAADPEVPHPRLHERAFVLVPLAELSPDYDVPGRGSVSDLLARVDCTGVQRLDQATRSRWS